MGERGLRDARLTVHQGVFRTTGTSSQGLARVGPGGEGMVLGGCRR